MKIQSIQNRSAARKAQTACGLALVTLIASAVSSSCADPAAKRGHAQAQASNSVASPPHSKPSSEGWNRKLPPLPKGVAELKFGEFFVTPVGARGLEITDKLRSLDGRRVRILGYMVQEETPATGQFLLAAIPVQIHSHDNSLADDLPPAALRVLSPIHHGQPVPFTPKLLLLTGKLEVGNREGPDQRNSVARLTLDPNLRPGQWPPARLTAAPDKGATALMKSRSAAW